MAVVACFGRSALVPPWLGMSWQSGQRQAGLVWFGFGMAMFVVAVSACCVMASRGVLRLGSSCIGKVRQSRLRLFCRRSLGFVMSWQSGLVLSMFVPAGSGKARRGMAVVSKRFIYGQVVSGQGSRRLLGRGSSRQVKAGLVRARPGSAWFGWSWQSRQVWARHVWSRYGLPRHGSHGTDRLGVAWQVLARHV